VRSDLGIEHVCQSCKKKKQSTQRRSIYMKVYEGPCDDSFCFASCESPSCKPKSLAICSECTTKLSHPKYGKSGP